MPGYSMPWAKWIIYKSSTGYKIGVRYGYPGGYLATSGRLCLAESGVSKPREAPYLTWFKNSGSDPPYNQYWPFVIGTPSSVGYWWWQPSGACSWWTAPAAPQGPVGGAVTEPSTRGGGSCGAPSTQVNVVQPVNTATGNFWHTFDDLAVDGRGPGLGTSRTYNSFDASSDGWFGWGWSSSYETSLAVSGASAVVTRGNGSQVAFALSGGIWQAAARERSTLVEHANGTWTFTCRGVDMFDFDAQGRLTARRDLNGNETTVSYPSASEVVATDGAGRTLSFSFTGGHVDEVTDSSTPARSVSFDYDVGGNLVEVVDGDGGHTTFTYDTSHRVLTMRFPKNHGVSATPTPVVTNHYDAQGRIDWQADELGRQTSFDYTTVADSTIVTDPKGNKTRYGYEYGILTELVRGHGTAQPARWLFDFDLTSTETTRVIDPRNNVWTSTYDTSGNRLSSTDPIARTTSATYTSLNRPLTVTDGEGITTTNTYDSAGNLLTTTTPWAQGPPGAIRQTTYTYGDTNSPGDVTAVTDGEGKVWTMDYDTAGNLTSSADPLGNTTAYCYDDVGRRTATIQPSAVATGVTCATTPPAAGTTYFTHNAAGQILTATNPLGETTTYTYDANGNPATVEDPNGNLTTYTHDAANQPTSVERADLITVSTTYWPDGAVKDQINGAGAATSYAYDAHGRLTTVTDPLNRTITLAYDAAGNLLTRQAAGGSCTATPKTGCITYSYDAANQLTAVDHSDTTPDVSTITYDDNGRRTGHVDGTGTWSSTWDSLGRMTTSTRTDGTNTWTVGYGWDRRDLLTSIAYPTSLGTVTRTYDDAGRMATVTDWLTNTTTFGYDTNGNLTTETKPNGTTATTTHDDANRAASISHAPTSTPTSPFATFDYTRDDLGQVSTVASTGVPTDDHTWTYTDINQLATDSVATDTYDHDNADNLTQLATGTTQQFDAANQLCWTDPAGGAATCSSPPTGATTYGYDTSGNRTSATTTTGTTVYGYDLQQRLQSHTAAGVTTTYGYSDSLRTTRTSGGTTTNFTWNVAEPLPLLLTEGSTAFVYGPGGSLLEQIDGTTVTHIHRDQLNSTRVATDASGTVVGTATYDPYGARASTTGTVSVLGYTGEYHDPESGLIYLRARHYDPATGQFLTRDPLEAQTREPYAYVSGNPTNRTDPTGLLCLGDWCAEDFVDAAGETIRDGAEWADRNSGTIATAATVASIFVPGAGFVAVGFGAWSAYSNTREGDYVGAALDVLGVVSGGAAMSLGWRSASLVRASSQSVLGRGFLTPWLAVEAGRMAAAARTTSALSFGVASLSEARGRVGPGALTLAAC